MKPRSKHDCDGTATSALPSPSALHQHPDHVQVADGLTATLIVTGYPAEVGPAWLEPLLSWPGRLDVILFIDPLTAPAAATRLRRQRARLELESSRLGDAGRGRVSDPLTEAAADDAAELADRVARGESKLFRVGLYLCVTASTQDELREAVAHVRSTAASVLLDTQPATWRQPLAVDGLRMRRVMDTSALAAAFPLAGADLPAPLPGNPGPAGGVLYGLNRSSHGVVWWDRWSQDNANGVVLARSGSGKSYFVKLEILRSLADGVHVAVIDPENEYLRLAEAVGGATIVLGAAGVHLNPLDIPVNDRRDQARTRRALFLHTLVAVLLGEQPPPAERAALDRAVVAAYEQAGITTDPATWHRPAPLLRDVTAALTRRNGTAGENLAARLTPWTHGSFRELFDGPTTTIPAGHLVCWSTRALADELRPAATLLALDAIWRDVDNPAPDPPRRLVVVDEAWTLMQQGEGARFLARLAKQARKRRAGLLVCSQDVLDVLGSDLGQIVIANAATQVLLRQAPQAIDLVSDAFALSAGEARTLLTSRRGEALLLSGTHRVGFQVVASPAEHRLCVGDLDPDQNPSSVRRESQP